MVSFKDEGRRHDHHNHRDSRDIVAQPSDTHAAMHRRENRIPLNGNSDTVIVAFHSALCSSGPAAPDHTAPNNTAQNTTGNAKTA